MAASESVAVVNISPQSLAQRLADGQPIQLLDVREPWELDICALPGVIAIPMQQVPARVSELSASVPVVCICHHGARSWQVANFLLHQGKWIEVSNLEGGMDAWARTVDSDLSVY